MTKSIFVVISILMLANKNIFLKNQVFLALSLIKKVRITIPYVFNIVISV